MRELRKSRDRKIAGVAAGFAEYFATDKTIWRTLSLLGCIFVPPFILAYFILAVVLPEAPAGGPVEPEIVEPEQSIPPNPRSHRRMTRSRDKWLAGVAAGIAEYFDLDPILVRALFLASIFLGGAGVLAYVILAILMPRPA